jgi:hypothetical protein
MVGVGMKQTWIMKLVNEQLHQLFMGNFLIAELVQLPLDMLADYQINILV